MALADIFVTFEESAEKYVTYKAPQYATKYKPSKFWHIVHSCSTGKLALETLQHFHKREAKWLYLTDLTMPNPYNDLASKEGWQLLLMYMLGSSRYSSMDDLPVVTGQ